MQLVRDIMTSTVRTLHPDTVIGDVEKVVLTNKISSAPLADTGTEVGFVSKKVRKFVTKNDA
jgi:predicted transcriptional regulator